VKDLSRLSRPSPWDLGNEVLYSLCANYPDHSDPDVVVAKLWLIGRAYASPLERGRPTPRAPKNEAFYTGHAVPIVLASPMDAWLRELNRTTLSWDTLAHVIAVHSRFTDLLCSISTRAHRSLASKYLHFHRPELFFIYDSRAAAAVRSECKRPRQISLHAGEADAAYALFARRCLELTETLTPQAPVPVTPRVVDRYLLEY